MTKVTEKEFTCQNCKKSYHSLYLHSFTTGIGIPKPDIKPPKCPHCGTEYSDDEGISS